MYTSIGCRELGMDCDFEVHGETEYDLIDSLMRHVNAVHAEDWFETEEIYKAATSKIREKAA